MDLSKLPKLSKRQQAQGSQNQPFPTEPPPLNYASTVLPAIGFAEAWISIGLGILLLLVFPNTIHYVCSPTTFQQNNSVTDAQGNAIAYINSAFFWTDLGVTVFASALILEGIILAITRRILPLMAALCVTSLAALFNILVIAHAYPLIGLPIVCSVAVIVLIYMAMVQWRLIATLRR